MSEDKILNLTVGEDVESERLDKYLSSHPTLELSRNKIQALLDDNQIIVNGEEANKKQKVQSGDTIHIRLVPSLPQKLEAENIPLDIVYEDDHLAIINKPPGLVTHPGTGNKKGTLVNALLYHFDSLATNTDSERPGIVHRLDKNTSGLLLIAKNDSSFQKLQAEIQAREVQRTYLAVICGHMKEDTGQIDLPIGRSIRDRKKMTVTNVNSREALTDYKLLTRYRTYDSLEINLKTGRTHQIRVHFSHLGHPIFGDPDYGGRDKWHKGIFGPERPLAKKLLAVLKRQALHARYLAFTHPVTGKEMMFEGKIPDDFNKLLHILNNEGV